MESIMKLPNFHKLQDLIFGAGPVAGYLIDPKQNSNTALQMVIRWWITEYT